MTHKKFGSDRFSCFDVYWIQTNRQAKFINRFNLNYFILIDSSNLNLFLLCPKFFKRLLSGQENKFPLEIVTIQDFYAVLHVLSLWACRYHSLVLLHASLWLSITVWPIKHKFLAFSLSYFFVGFAIKVLRWVNYGPKRDSIKIDETERILLLLVQGLGNP